MMLKRLKDIVEGKAPKHAKRSSKWRKVRRQFLKKNPRCAVCGSRHRLEVHHIVPFHVDPSKELDPSNLITLCENKKYGINCHLLVGHRGSYRDFNKNIHEDVSLLKKLLRKDSDS